MKLLFSGSGVKMRFTKYIMLVALFFITNCVGISAASAVNSGFTNQIIHDADERSRLLSGFDLVKIDHEYRGPCSICSYDVSAEGQIAVAFSPINVHNRRINVYDQKGIFLYSLKFSDYGGFQIEYDQLDNQLMIHLSRSKLLLKIDESGVVVDLAQVYSSKVNSSYAIELDVLTELDRNGNKYVRSGILPDNMIGSMINYTKISIIYPRGDSRIVFDNTLLHLASILIPLLLLPLILCAFLLLVYALIKNAGVMNRTKSDFGLSNPRWHNRRVIVFGYFVISSDNSSSIANT
jgi:hypothetical protein